MDWLSTSKDFRASDFRKFDANTKKAIAHASLYRMLERSGFDISPVSKEISDYETKRLSKFTNILFSPFHELNSKELAIYFPKIIGKENPENQINIAAKNSELLTAVPAKEPRPKEARISLRQLVYSKTNDTNEHDRLKKEIFSAVQIYKNDLPHVIEHLMRLYKSSNQDTFYPVVAKAFSLIGYNCQVSRAGVNYQRWDAYIEDQVESIPIEIKSPTATDCSVSPSLSSTSVAKRSSDNCTYFGLSSNPIPFLPSNAQAFKVDPTPRKGSKTVQFSFVKNRINRRTSVKENGAGCCFSI